MGFHRSGACPKSLWSSRCVLVLPCIIFIYVSHLTLSVAEMVTTLAGSEYGHLDGSGPNARFRCPSAVCLNPHDQCLYVCDRGNEAIRKVTLQGMNPAISACVLSFNYGRCRRCYYICCEREYIQITLRDCYGLQTKCLLRCL